MTVEKRFHIFNINKPFLCINEAINIQLLECPRPPLRPPVIKIWMAIFRKRKELREIRWCQNDQNFESFSDFQKIDFLDFWISVFFGFLAISQERKELPEIRWCQNNRIFEGFSDFWVGLTA